MPKVSVIIPTYKGSILLGNAIQSILGQTYSDYELIIVNDASPDKTTEVVEGFNDPRIKYIVHEKNQGVDRARCSGISASVGDIIAFLDQDDFYHPEKLEAHVQFLERYSDIGFTYNARFELDYSAKTIRDIWRPAQNVTLSDLVLWFPIAPSDWVLRRKWALELAHLMSTSRRWTGGEIVYLSDLLMKGCKFALVNRALNYRWHHSGRVFKDLAGGCNFEIAAQQEVLTDPRCPPEVLALRNTAHANIYMFWAYRAFVQKQMDLGQVYIREAIRSRPSILSGKPSELMSNILLNCCDDAAVEHPVLLRRVFEQLPEEAASLLDQYDWAVARGYLIKGTRLMIWGRMEQAREYLHHAASSRLDIDEPFLSQLAGKVIDFEMEFGDAPSRLVLDRLIQALGNRSWSRQLIGVFAMNSAFQKYHERDFTEVLDRFFQAIRSKPSLAVNRGLISIVLRSIFRFLVKGQAFTHQVE